MDPKKTGNIIAEARKQSNMTQKELANKLYVSDKAVSKWERGLCFPDVAVLIPLTEVLNISLYDLLRGEKMNKKEVEETLKNTINYSNKKILEKNNTIGLIFILFGLFITITAMTVFPSESSWGSIYSVFGAIISLIGISKFTKKLSYVKRLFINFGYFILFTSLLFVLDYVSVINMKQAPRFSTYKISADTSIYYDTPFYDVIRCNINTKKEYYEVLNNKKYDKSDIQKYCKK